ncbi:MAG: SIS domain-containing protein, partial [bacterium]
MLSPLSDIEKIKKLDKQNMLSSIEMLPRQIEQVLSDFTKIRFPRWKNISNIVVCGMGGSTLGSHIIKTAHFEELKTSMEIVNNYSLPGWTDKNTLCVISSYSGNTEEPLSCLEEAEQKTRMIFAMASGGQLGEAIKNKSINGYLFNPEFNPCGEPRMGLGYSLFSQIMLFKNLNIINVHEKKIDKIPTILKKIINDFGITNSNNNSAKIIAENLRGCIPIIIASDFLQGSAHAFNNQINENAKTFAAYFAIPEINHHLMESLRFPKGKNALKFVLIKSKFYHKKNRLRYEITEKILKNNKIKYISYECAEQDKLTQILEILALGSFAGFYMSMLNRIDPTPIPNVDYFKMEMAK